MATEHDRIPEIALDWAKGGRDVALATVVETWGSAPRPVGSQLVIDGDARMMGSVSGGCVEGAVVAEALDALVEVEEVFEARPMPADTVRDAREVVLRHSQFF
ncbi:MAG: XdhC family protein, partial [Pseudomonadota bacterium]